MNNAVSSTLTKGDSQEAPRLLFRVRPELSADAVRAVAQRFGELAQVTVVRRPSGAVAVVDFSEVRGNPREVGKLMCDELSRLSPNCVVKVQKRKARLRSSGSEALTPVPAWVAKGVAGYAQRMGAANLDANRLPDPGDNFEHALSNHIRIYGLLEPADLLDYSEPLAGIVVDQARRLLLRFLACCEPARQYFPPELIEISAKPQERASFEASPLREMLPDSSVGLDLEHLSVDIKVNALEGFRDSARIAAWGLFCLFPTRLFRGQHLVTQFVVSRALLKLPSNLITGDSFAQEPGNTRDAVQADDDDLMNELLEEIEV